MAHDWLRRLGWRVFNIGESVGSADLTNVGRAVLATILDLVVARSKAPLTSYTLPPSLGEPLSGFHGSDCFALATGADTVSVASGVVWVYDDSSADTFTPAYFPCPVEAETFDVEANASGNPRIDLLYVLPTEVDGDSASRRVRMAGPGSQAVQTLDTSRGWVGVLGIAKGTPSGSPVAPTLPAGAIAIAEIDVPHGVPGSASITVRDVRTLLVPGDGHEALPPYPHGASAVVSGLGVSASSGLTLAVGAGVADVYTSTGVSYATVRTAIPAHTVTLEPADSTYPRIDLVYLNAVARNVLVETGTPAALPDRPLPVAGSLIPHIIPLAWVRVDANKTALTAGDITDARRLRGAADVLSSRRTVVPLVTVGADSAGARTVRVQAVDRDGMPYEGTVRFRLELWDDSTGAITIAAIIQTPTVGTFIEGIAGWQLLSSTSGGILEVPVVRLSGADPFVGFLVITPIDYIDATASGVVAPALPAYVPGGSATVHIEIADPA